MTHNLDLARSSDHDREAPVHAADLALELEPPVSDAPARVDATGVELRATTDIISKIGVLGLDNAITTFIARSEAVGDQARSRSLFRVAVVLGLLQSVVTAVIVIVALRFFNRGLHVQPQMVSVLSLVLCAMPGLALYRICTAISRGMKVMQHDIYSRGMTEPIATTLAFLLAIAVGFNEFSPEVAVIVGTAASGIVALRLASSCFHDIPAPTTVMSPVAEAR
ncbi:MAG: hypothetical protein DME91_07060 [Verrucomicrobia bacterium]|nr:MAG: hypothetical protein DME91_07060 [Verrucomicrobiota bacterium]